MTDTHGASGAGWYGFDLDGTLAKYDGWKGIDHIGEPVKPMVDLMKKMRDAGILVKIVTARVSPRDDEQEIYRDLSRVPPYAVGIVPDENGQKALNGMYTVRKSWRAREFIVDWCARNLGFVPEITHQKDYLMLNLFDDRVTQVEPNTGRILGRLPIELNVYGARRGKYVDKKCERCGNIEKMYSSARFCSACRAIRMKEANREAYIRKAMAG